MLDEIIEDVSAEYRVSIEALCGRSRVEPLPEARRVVMYLADKYDQTTQELIAESVGVLRSNVSTGLHKAKWEYSYIPSMRAHILKLEEKYNKPQCEPYYVMAAEMGKAMNLI